MSDPVEEIPLEPGSEVNESPPPAPPAFHLRALLARIALFPVVSVGLVALAPFGTTWNPLLREVVLTIVAVWLSVHLVVSALVRRRKIQNGR